MSIRERTALYFDGPRQIALRREAVPALDGRSVLVQTLVSAISSGTEMLFYRGQVPDDIAVDATIEALAGEFSFPLKYGYAAVGQVVALGSEVDESWLGKMVFAFHPHESHFISPFNQLHLVPEDLPAETAVFLPLMETAVSFLMDGQPLIGEQVVLLGQGIVGLLTTALLAAYPLGDLIALDPYALRRQWSERLGAKAFDPTDPGTKQKLSALLQSKSTLQGADLIYELSGNPAALDQAISLVGYDGRIIIGSWYGKKGAALDLGGRFHRSHARLISSQVSHIAPRWRGRFDQQRRLDIAWTMLAQHQPERLISHRFPLSQASAAYELLDRHPESALQVVLTYGGEPS